MTKQTTCCDANHRFRTPACVLAGLSHFIIFVKLFSRRELHRSISSPPGQKTGDKPFDDGLRADKKCNAKLEAGIQLEKLIKIYAESWGSA
jgi:hypothetical protein